jgi:hypothetical protein
MDVLIVSTTKKHAVSTYLPWLCRQNHAPLASPAVAPQPVRPGRRRPRRSPAHCAGACPPGCRRPRCRPPHRRNAACPLSRSWPRYARRAAACLLDRPAHPASPATAAAHSATRPTLGPPRRLPVHRSAGHCRRRAPPRAFPSRWPRMRHRTWRRTCGGRAPHGPGVDPPGRIAGIGAAPPATSGSPSPDLPICAVRASFPASAAALVINRRNRRLFRGRKKKRQSTRR